MVARNGRGAAAGPDTGPEQRFIGVNVADTAQEVLIEERALDGSLAAAEQRQEAVEIDFQRFDAGGVEVSCRRDAQAAEAAGIDETQFLAGRQFEDGVGVLGDFGLRFADLQAACHAEVDDPLGFAVRGAAAPARLCWHARRSWRSTACLPPRLLS